MELYKLSENCDYGEMKSKMIRDRFVIGIRDSALSEQLQIDPDLTLEEAKKNIRQHKTVHEQQRELKGTEATSTVREVQARRKHPTKGSTKKSKAKPLPQAKQCTRCGGLQHPKEKCPAKEAVCHRCKKKGHYSR